MTAQRLDINSRTTDRGVSWTGNIPLDPAFFADGEPHSLTAFRALLADDDNPAELYIEIDGPLLGPNFLDFHNLTFTLSSELGEVGDRIHFRRDRAVPVHAPRRGTDGLQYLHPGHSGPGARALRLRRRRRAVRPGAIRWLTSQR